MMPVRDYLLEMAKDQRERYVNPVTAMDRIAGNIRADQLEKLAERISSMDDQDAIAYLVSRRDDARNNISGPDGIALWASHSASDWMDRVVDRISRENVGWIEVSNTHAKGSDASHFPFYRRMISRDECTHSLTRDSRETDATWMARRSEWLSWYHPEIKVFYADTFAHEWDVLGDIASFVRIEHLIESGFYVGNQISTWEGSVYECTEVNWKYDPNGFVGKVKQVEGAPQNLHEFDCYGYRFRVAA